MCVQPLQRIENEVELLGDHLPVGGSFNYAHSGHPSPLPSSTPLQFLSHDPLPQELFGVVSGLLIILIHEDLFMNL